ncbi:MAG: ornithine carbamoyltransferase [Acidobacteria bacterium]|nr:ornithine carbamoyltransferase [Acidobacteriota bacterium]MBV9477183.1 ornithine carbamoyltransferase [Acidobacteriota bacterium]
MRHKDFIEIHDYTAAEVLEIFALAAEMKAKPKKFRDALEGQTLAMIFEKSSTRTRVSFEAGMFQLGGHALFLSARDIQLGRGEPIYDTAKVLARYVDGIMARTFAHKTVTDLAEYASVPVINGLTDLSHPCQAMTDYFTAWEKFGGELKGRKLAYVGDGNNMAHSLMFGAPKVGMDIAVATPAGYGPDPGVIAQAQSDAQDAGTKLILTHSIEEAVEGADVVETDVWASMGQEDEAEKRRRDFEGWMIDARFMGLARKEAVFMHCLPAHRGEEVSADVIDGAQSVIYDEAENRLHIQKAILHALMKK